MKKWQKIVIGSFSVFIVVVIAGTILLYNLLHSAVPSYSGSVKTSGIKSSVEIFRDSVGIPYIFASDDEDAAFALGYLHAQERLFQMDIARRAAEGRLSEVFGSRTLQFDKMFLTMGLKRNVYSNYKYYSDSTKKILQAYSNGVNEYIKDSKGKLSVEFDLLKYEPYDWRPEHSLLLIKMMAWELNISLWADIAYLGIKKKLGIDKAKEIIPDYPENGKTIIQSDIKSFADARNDIINTDREFRKFMGITGTHIGSNNWVINGDKSASGKPIIANDPHLAFQAPGKWYAVILKSNNWNACGVTVPGVPVVVIGKNNSISWVLTNVMADDADFYCEKIDSTNNYYFYKGNWQKLQEYEEQIYVKDSALVRIKIKSTHRGPIISNHHPYSFMFPGNTESIRGVSMRWTANEFSDEFLAYYLINKAKNWEEFNSAVTKFSVPGQNFVYADSSGNIGYICGAKLPIRKLNTPTFLNDGTNDVNDWIGYVPYEEMPKLFNPAQNFIATANNKVINNFRYHISNIWEPASRIARINELLNFKSKHSVDDFMLYQHDNVSKYASEITPFILNAFKDVTIHDENLKKALFMLRKWDFRMDEFREVPSIYAVFLNCLLKNIFYDKLGEQLFNEYLFLANIPYRVLLQLLKQPNSSWFDNQATPEKESRDMTIRKSFSQALSELENQYGDNITKWQWGKLHKVTFKHFFSGALPFINNLVNIGPFSIGGDGTTLFNTEYSFCTYPENSLFKQEKFANVLGPSMRFVYDFSKPDEFYLILTTGQSGHIFSSHYSDMTRMWLDGKYFKVCTDENSIRKLKTKLELY